MGRILPPDIVTRAATQLWSLLSQSYGRQHCELPLGMLPHGKCIVSLCREPTVQDQTIETKAAAQEIGAGCREMGSL